MPKKNATKNKARTSTKKTTVAKTRNTKKPVLLSQITTRLSPAFKNKMTTFAKTRGLKMNHLINEALSMYMQANQKNESVNA